MSDPATFVSRAPVEPAKDAAPVTALLDARITEELRSHE